MIKSTVNIYMPGGYIQVLHKKLVGLFSGTLAFAIREEILLRESWFS